jgi:hypothetical protein
MKSFLRGGHFPYEKGNSINFFTYGIYKIPAIQEKRGG